MLNQILRPVAQNVARRGSRAYHPPAHYKEATMDEIPIPQGSWKTRFDNKQKKYNLHLLIGVGTFVGTVTYAAMSDALHLHWRPPTPKN